MDDTIRYKVWHCSRLFKQVLSDAPELFDANQRFVEWYTNIAAHRTGPASLDERLRDAPDLRDAILQFLNTLIKAIEFHVQTLGKKGNTIRRNPALDSLVNKAASSRPVSVMHTAVDSLKRLSIAIRTPASVDRYAKAKNIDIDYFGPSDKGHIEDLFPKADPVLQDRLLQAVLRRRRFLKYSADHKEKLARQVTLEPDQEGDETQETLFAGAESEFADTVATPFSPHDVDMDGIVPMGISDSASDGASTNASDTSSLRSDMAARVPPMPPASENGKPFECPCCFLMIETRTRKQWKRHVFTDMRPYVCTFIDCKDPDQLFPSRHDWYSHELAFHRRTWFCISSCARQFATQAQIVAHLREAHKEFESSSQAEKYGAHSRQLPEPQVSICPLCGDEITHELVKTHIGRHQAPLGLWPLRSMREFDDDDEEEDERIEEDEEDDAQDNSDDEDHTTTPQGTTKLTIDVATPGESDSQAEQVTSHSSSAESTRTKLPLNPEDYTIGWICALPIELVAARACLDVTHPELPHIPANDNNQYTTGQIGSHYIVICSLPEGAYGTASAAAAAVNLSRSFPRVRFGVMVGIGGGAPSAIHDIRLGDVVVSSPTRGSGGVVQLDVSKLIQGQGMASTGMLSAPPSALLAATASLRAKHELDGVGIENGIERIFRRNLRLSASYSRPDPTSDRLYRSDYIHVANGPCEEGCDPKFLVTRPERSEDDDNPAVHYGLIASGDRLVRDASFRDSIARERGVLCFEMEAAGLMDNFPCIVIRGIADYCDSHKARSWQRYAALSAAVYTRDLILGIHPSYEG